MHHVAGGHALDPCAFLVYELDDPNYDASDPVHETVNSFGDHRMVGMIIMHVDDLLGTGCPNSPRYQAVVAMLKSNFSFREWKEEQRVLEYCGCELEKTSSGGRKLHQTKYMEKVKPINYMTRSAQRPTTCMSERSRSCVVCWAHYSGRQCRHLHTCSVAPLSWLYM